jgi:hypothetical protein
LALADGGQGQGAWRFQLEQVHFACQGPIQAEMLISCGEQAQDCLELVCNRRTGLGQQDLA